MSRRLFLFSALLCVSASCSTILGIDHDYRLGEGGSAGDGGAGPGTGGTGATSSATTAGDTSMSTTAGGSGGSGAAGGNGGVGGTGGIAGSGGTGAASGSGGFGGTTGSGGLAGSGGTTGSGGLAGSGGTGGVGPSSSSGGGVCVPATATSCYEGPVGTQNVGECANGFKVCNVDGLGYGPCLGQVLPAAELCGDAKDQNCDGQDQPCPGGCSWAKQFGGSVAQSARAVAFDGAGDVLVGGVTDGPLDFGGGVVQGGGGGDIFVAKLSAAAGAHSWSKGYGDAMYQELSGLTVDAGKAVLTGTFTGSLNFGPAGGVGCGAAIISAGNTDVFVAALDGGSGDCALSSRYGDTQAQFGRDVAARPGGGFFLTGYYSSAISFGAGVCPGACSLTSSGQNDVFLASFDAAGTPEASRKFGSTVHQYGIAVASAANGDAILAGYTSGSSIDLGQGPQVLGGASDAFVVRMQPSLVTPSVFANVFGDGVDQYAFDVAVDTSGNTILLGQFSGSISFTDAGMNLVTLTSAGTPSIFLIKMGSNGVPLWGKKLGNLTVAPTALSVAVDGAGNIVIAGGFSGSIDFGAGPLASDMTDVFVAKLDPNGGHIYGKKLGGAGNQTAYAVAADGSGRVVVAGGFKNTLDFGGIQLTSAGDDDVFVAVFDP